MNTKDKYGALITIRGEYDGDDEAVELVTSGSFSGRDGGYEIKYSESELTGMEGTSTTLFVHGGRITVERQGAVSTQMIFEKGVRHISAYNTPFGTMLVGVSASSVSSEFDATGGSLSVDYSLEIDHALAGYNSFTLTVRNKPSQGTENSDVCI